MNNTIETQLHILEELKALIVPLGPEEKRQLEISILEEGCRDAIVTWKHEGQEVIVDGHNRYEICSEHDIPFSTTSKEFKNLEEVRFWMINNQIGRRNLNSDQMSYYRGMKYLMSKKEKGGNEYASSKVEDWKRTAHLLSEQYGVSESTIKRDAKYAEGLEIIAQSNPALKKEILFGEVKVQKGVVRLLSDLEETEKKRIRIHNRSDLETKASAIQGEALRDIEQSVNTISSQGSAMTPSQETKIPEPMFNDQEDRINKLKGNIMSALNQAIKTRDHSAMNELKNLIGKLEKCIFDD